MALATFLSQVVQSEKATALGSSSSEAVGPREFARLIKLEAALAACRNDMDLCPSTEKERDQAWHALSRSAKLLDALDEIEKAMQRVRFPSFMMRSGGNSPAPTKEVDTTKAVSSQGKRLVVERATKRVETIKAAMDNQGVEGQVLVLEPEKATLCSDKPNELPASVHGLKGAALAQKNAELQKVQGQCIEEALRLYTSGESLPALFHARSVNMFSMDGLFALSVV
jgi:hypothetical protein